MHVIVTNFGNMTHSHLKHVTSIDMKIFQLSIATESSTNWEPTITAATLDVRLFPRHCFVYTPSQSVWLHKSPNESRFKSSKCLRTLPENYDNTQWNCPERFTWVEWNDELTTLLCSIVTNIPNRSSRFMLPKTVSPFLKYSKRRPKRLQVDSFFFSLEFFRFISTLPEAGSKLTILFIRQSKGSNQLVWRSTTEDITYPHWYTASKGSSNRSARHADIPEHWVNI